MRIKSNEEVRTYVTLTAKDGKPAVCRTIYGATPAEVLKVIEGAAEKARKRDVAKHGEQTTPEPSAA